MKKYAECHYVACGIRILFLCHKKVWKRIEEGIEKRIDILIRTCREFGLSRTLMYEKLMKDFLLLSEKAEEYLKRFWPEIA